MTETHTPQEMDKMLFTSLTMMLSSSAMQQLGKLVNPATHRAEVNLEAAQMHIDMLEMLRNKTKGNLDADEGRLIGDVLATLQMNYVQVAQTAPAPEASGAEPPKSETAAGAPATPVDGAPKPDEKAPKYRKSYGA